ncbi:MAG: hypothetical protein LBU34_09170 [Planctomycetaceae bacterium]|jgi:hypothetical protein|nr:hypothetical protein [Planctomycetaceae bacterium]
MVRQFFPVFIYASLFNIFLNISVSAQSNPIDHLSVDKVETRNFEIVMERSLEHRRPTAKEVGVLTERLCALLDKVFQKYAPQRVADELEQQKIAEAKGQKYIVSQKREVDYNDPNRVIPKCRIFIFNDRTGYEAQCRFDEIEPKDEGYAGFFTTKNNSIYMMRSWSLQSTRETILHETTHYYMYNFLPGGWRCYPKWFHEGLATMYEHHTWNGDKLVIGVPPRIQPFDSPAAGLAGLLRFRTFLQNKTAQTTPTTEHTKQPVKKETKTETPIDPELIQPFLETMFTQEQFLKEGIVLKNPHEEISHCYAMYETFGRFLMVARPDLLDAILRQVALWEKEKDKTFPKKQWFIEAWKKTAAEKPVTVEEIGRWLRKNQLPFKWSFGDWQDQGDQIAGKAKEEKISLLAISNPQTLPKFTIFLKNAVTFQAGVIINFIDEKNFGVVAVDQDGNVIQMERQHDNWSKAKIIGKTTSVMNRRNPYPNGLTFQFSVMLQNKMLVVGINNTPVGTWVKNPKASCGFFLGGAEAVFTY